jgi:hypothetical protein
VKTENIFFLEIVANVSTMTSLSVHLCCLGNLRNSIFGAPSLIPEYQTELFLWNTKSPLTFCLFLLESSFFNRKDYIILSHLLLLPLGIVNFKSGNIDFFLKRRNRPIRLPRKLLANNRMQSESIPTAATVDGGLTWERIGIG